jgi:predicted N-acetyltransferase YhbS
MVAIHSERPGDAASIRAVHAASLPSDAEGRQVDLLRAATRSPVSLDAVVGRTVIGHIAFSPVPAASGAVGPGLAPVAVSEPYRRKRFAAELIRGAWKRAGSLALVGWW